MSDVSMLTKTVVQVLNDGARGFADIGEHLKDPAAKSFFLEESKKRGLFATEVATAAGLTEDAGGTVAGSVHRAWGDLKANLGGGDHTLLATAEQGEDATKKAYTEALDSDATPEAVKSILRKQHTEILASHDRVKALRDSTK